MFGLGGLGVAFYVFVGSLGAAWGGFVGCRGAHKVLYINEFAVEH